MQKLGNMACSLIQTPFYRQQCQFTPVPGNEIQSSSINSAPQYLYFTASLVLVPSGASTPTVIHVPTAPITQDFPVRLVKPHTPHHTLPTILPVQQCKYTFPEMALPNQPGLHFGLFTTALLIACNSCVHLSNAQIIWSGNFYKIDLEAGIWFKLIAKVEDCDVISVSEDNSYTQLYLY